MVFCTKCGTQMDDSANFCTICGQPVMAGPASTNGATNQAPPQQEYQQVPPQQGYQAGYQQVPPQGYSQGYQQQGYQQAYQQAYQNYADPRWDAENNKIYGILAYLGILVLISLLAAPKESKYSKFHANQGLVLLILDLAGAIILGIITGIIVGVGVAVSMGLLAMMLITVLWIAFGILLLVLAIMGIVSAAKGEMKPLPIIGKFILLK